MTYAKNLEPGMMIDLEPAVRDHADLEDFPGVEYEYAIVEQVLPAGENVWLCTDQGNVELPPDYEFAVEKLP
jgi:hypothetical protein